MSENEFQLVKIETHILKVHIHCDGCAEKVKKLLKRIEGVYLVSIDTEEQKVKVSGTVDCATLIRKLNKFGKHAELWSPSHRQNQNLQGLNNWLLDVKYQNPMQCLPNGINASNTQQPYLASEFDRGIDDRSRQRYPNESAGIKSLMGETNNYFRATTVSNNTPFTWDGNIIPEADSIGGKLRSMGFPDSSKYAGAFGGFEDGGYPGLQTLQSFSAYEPYYSPFLMTNNMQQYRYNFPPPMMMNNDMPDMHNFYNTRINDNSHMHQYQGNINPMFPLVNHHSWSYY